MCGHLALAGGLWVLQESQGPCTLAGSKDFLSTYGQGLDLRALQTETAMLLKRVLLPHAFPDEELKAQRPCHFPRLTELVYVVPTLTASTLLTPGLLAAGASCTRPRARGRGPGCPGRDGWVPFERGWGVERNLSSGLPSQCPGPGRARSPKRAAENHKPSPAVLHGVH